MLGGPMDTNLECECLGKDTHPSGIICVNTTGSLFNILPSSTSLEEHSQVAHLKQRWNLDQFTLNMLLSRCHTMTFLGKCPNSLSHQFFHPHPQCIFKQGTYFIFGRWGKGIAQWRKARNTQKSEHVAIAMIRWTSVSQRGGDGTKEYLGIYLYVQNHQTPCYLQSGWCYLRSGWWRED